MRQLEALKLENENFSRALAQVGLMETEMKRRMETMQTQHETAVERLQIQLNDKAEETASLKTELDMTVAKLAEATDSFQFEREMTVFAEGEIAKLLQQKKKMELQLGELLLEKEYGASISPQTDTNPEKEAEAEAVRLEAESLAADLLEKGVQESSSSNVTFDFFP